MPEPTKQAFSLHGRTAVITGAASGIGLAIARAFVRQGASVSIVDRKGADAREVAEEITRSGGQAEAVVCDVADADSVRVAFDGILARGPVHILVNNAGVAHVGNLANTAEADFDRVFQVNVKGFYLCMRAVLEPMRRNGGGVILNMASIAATTGLSDRFAYSASKGAVLSMTLSVARDFLRDGIRCNAISPARVRTPFVEGFVAKNYPGREEEMLAKLASAQPIGRMAQPEEVADLAVYLCSDEASFVTGENYAIDGGYLTLRG